MAPSLLTITEAGINLGDRWLLRGASLSLHAGDKLALVGAAALRRCCDRLGHRGDLVER